MYQVLQRVKVQLVQFHINNNSHRNVNSKICNFKAMKQSSYLPEHEKVKAKYDSTNKQRQNNRHSTKIKMLTKLKQQGKDVQRKRASKQRSQRYTKKKLTLIIPYKKS